MYINAITCMLSYSQDVSHHMNHMECYVSVRLVYTPYVRLLSR